MMMSNIVRLACMPPTWIVNAAWIVNGQLVGHFVFKRTRILGVIGAYRKEEELFYSLRMGRF
jgi:hypothetical protein